MLTLTSERPNFSLSWFILLHAYTLNCSRIGLDAVVWFDEGGLVGGIGVEKTPTISVCASLMTAPAKVASSFTSIVVVTGLDRICGCAISLIKKVLMVKLPVLSGDHVSFATSVLYQQL